MKTTFVSVVYDRKKRVNATGEGKVELYIHFSRREKKYVTIKTCNPIAWRKYQNSDELRLELAMYHQVAQKMYDTGELMTIANLNNHLGISPSKPKRKEMDKRLSSKDGFISFMSDEIAKEQFAGGTKSHKKVTIDAIIRFGRLSSFSQLTPENVKAFDDFLHKESARTLTTINNYHKTVRTSKERRPLTEDELIQIRYLDDLPDKLEKARDLFIFCAYTGLSYSDSQIFNFSTMTEKQDNLYYIDGKRLKTGNSFFTPILPPAMDILMKYGYNVPKLSNQKANDYLHDIEARIKLNKPLTVHVARHSFATLLMANDVPMENIAKMLGHANIRTTQIYAHILHSTIQRHASTLLTKIR